MLKIITDADDAGIRKVQKGMGDVEVSSHKASHAAKEFIRDLGSINSAGDLASAALGSFSKLLAGSLAGTAIIVGGKAIIDIFGKVTEIVDKTKESFNNVAEAIKKGDLPTNFQEGAVQARRLSDEVDKINKEIDNLSKGEEVLIKGDLKGYFMGLAATIMGSREELVKLRDEAKKLANEKMLDGARAALETAQQTKNLNDEQLALYKLRTQAEADIQKSSLEAGALIVQKYEIDKAAIINKFAKEQKAEHEKAQIESAKQELKEYEAMSSGKLAAQKILFESESKEQESRAKALQDEIKSQQELQKLYEDRATQLEKLIAAQDTLNKKQNELASQGMGLGGSMRGPGQAPTSYELGVKKAQTEAQTKAQIKDAETYRQKIQDELVKKQGYDPSKLSKAEKNAIKGASPEAVQIEQKKRAVEDARTKAVENGTKSLEKLQQNVNDAQKSFDKTQNKIDNFGKSADKGSAVFDGKDYSLVPKAENLVDSFLKGTTSADDFTETLDDGTSALEDFNKTLQGSGAVGGRAAATKTTTDNLSNILQKITQILDELKSAAHAT